MIDQNSAPAYLPDGSGELGRLIREKNWVHNSVGSQSEWPQSLKTSLDIVLQSKFPMVLFWGSELICFYNDAFRPSLGTDGKHPFILGIPAKEAWAETWHIMGPLLSEVMNGKGAIWFEDLLVPNYRNGKIEQVNWTFSYNPVKDDEGQIGGVIVHCMETTQKVQLHKKLEENERRLRLILNQAPAAMAIFKGPNFVTEIANNKSLEVWGKTSEEVLGRPIIDVLPELKSQGIWELLDRVYRTGKTFSASELPVQFLRNGKLETLYINFSYDALYNDKGEIDGIITIGYDVTEQVIFHKKNQANEEKLRLVIEASEIGTYEYDIKNKNIEGSPKFHSIFGLQDADTIDHYRYLHTIHPKDISIRDQAIKNAFQSSQLEYVSRLLFPDQSIKWIEVKGKVFYDQDKKPDKLLGTVRDITADKVNQQSLEESEQKFRLLADSLPQQIWTADIEGTLNYFNQTVYDFSGFTRDRLAKEGWISIVHPDNREGNIIEWMKSIMSGKDFLFEHRFMKHDGTYRWQLSRAKPQLSDDGEIQRWVGSSTDIHDQKEFTKELEHLVIERTNELNQNVKDLANMNKELQSFAYISSHDLQEPLRKIQMFSTLLMEDELENLSDKGKEHFKRMQKAAKRMQILINDLLAYSRSTVAERKFELTDLNKIVEEVKADLKEEIVQHKASVQVNTLCKLNIIPFQFRQLLQNLISNSLKFSTNDRQSKIFIDGKKGLGSEFDYDRLEPNCNYCHIQVSDNGIGFEQQYADRIFELFQRLHGKEKYQGTGIGLAIVKKIVENHNGFITAKGQLDKGATFDIYIPEN
jgi:hypothetical protein